MKKKPETKAKKPKPTPVSKVMKASVPRSAEVKTENRFPIVGIGSSAGGLEALELFLANVPQASGMAFVIVQHLDPTRKGILAELLQRSTAMPVVQVRDRTRIKPNCVYIIPPNKDMSILHGVLHLLTPITPRGLRLPIDFFFRSLADDQQEHGIGVILSGMGSDGTLGLRAIKEKAGVVFVQDPVTAKFDGMPLSAIESGLADVTAPVEALPAKIIAYLHHIPLIAAISEQEMEDKSHSGLEKVVILLRTQTGHDFSLYKKSTIYRRIERRMGIHQIEKISTYVRYLQENPQELDLLFKELLIGVTSFFRDPFAWEQLKNEVLPALLLGRQQNQTLRAWVPGCATGEEAYSLAILFKETVEKFKPAHNFTLQIFATDLDHDAIEKARDGFFPANIATDISPERLRRFFIRTERGYQVTKQIREMVIFASQNLIMDPPFTKLDILSCRNLLIYLSADLQKKLLPLFHYSLNPGGCLFLGSAETIGNFTNLFTPVDGKSRLYRRLDASLQAEPVDFPSAFISSRPSSMPLPQMTKPIANLQSLADQLLLQVYSPPAVLTNEKGDIIYVSGRTGKYLEPAAGKANWNIFAMAREGLRHKLSGAFQKAVRHGEAITLNNLTVGMNGGTQIVDVMLHPLKEPTALRGTVLIVFREVYLPPAVKKINALQQSTPHDRRVAELERELEQARQEALTLNEEMQTSQEELKSANEELQSTNEELQSTNEELTTSKEEMQSMNEELQTVNQELQAKVDEFLRTNADMRNLLDSTHIATLFLDGDMRVRRFTNQATKIINLIDGDIGRPITDIASDLLYETLIVDAQEVLHTLVPIEKQIVTRDERWYAARVQPYRTFENRIDGVVITYMEITTAKHLEAELRRVQSGLEKRVADQNVELDKSEKRNDL